MGEFDGDGIVMRWPMDEGGVGRSDVVELAEPDEADETDTERLRPRAGPMGIGLE